MSHNVPSGVPLASLADDRDYPCQPLGLSKGVFLSMPDVSTVGRSVPPIPQRRQVEATFTPTAAGLRKEEGDLLGDQLDLQTMLSTALSRILAAGIQQATQLPSQALPLQPLPRVNCLADLTHPCSGSLPHW